MREFAKPISVDEALRASAIQIEVREGESLALGFSSAEYAEAYRIAAVRGFEELQAIGLVPDGVSERELVEAVTDDDRRFQEYQTRVVGLPETSQRAGAPALAGTFSRRTMQTSLIQALPASARSRLRSAEDVVYIHGQVRRWIDRPKNYLIGIELAQSITVDAGATLTMLPTVQAVQMDVITLKSAATLRFEASSVFVRCSELNGISSSAGPDYTLKPPPYKFIIPDYVDLGPEFTTIRRYLPGFAAEQLLITADGA